METNTNTGGLFRNLLPWTKRDAAEAARRREQGIAQVVRNSSEWAKKARVEADNALRSLAVGTLFIGEDLRIAVLERGIEPPAHPNAWGGVIGGVIRNALKNGTVRPNGLHRASTAQSHRRVSAQYQKIV